MIPVKFGLLRGVVFDQGDNLMQRYTFISLFRVGLKVKMSLVRMASQAGDYCIEKKGGEKKEKKRVGRERKPG